MGTRVDMDGCWVSLSVPCCRGTTAPRGKKPVIGVELFTNTEPPVAGGGGGGAS